MLQDLSPWYADYPTSAAILTQRLARVRGAGEDADAGETARPALRCYPSRNQRPCMSPIRQVPGQTSLSPEPVPSSERHNVTHRNAQQIPATRRRLGSPICRASPWPDLPGHRHDHYFRSRRPACGHQHVTPWPPPPCSAKPARAFRIGAPGAERSRGLYGYG
jgi:hypothetical protein